MVGHQGIGMQGAPFFLQGLAQPVQVSMVVLFGKETRLAVMAALHNVKRHTGWMRGRRGTRTLYIRQRII